MNTPWSLIGLDVSGPLKRTVNGNSYVLVALDYFTKYCVAKAVPDFTAETTAKFIFEEIICKLGSPKSILSDHGVNFKSKLFKRLCELCNIKTANSSFYHASGNGLVERMNRTMKQILTMYVDRDHSNWDDFLQASIVAYNTTVHSSSKFSPYEANYGRAPITLADVMLSTPVDLSERSTSDYVVQLKQNASRINKKINEHLDKAHQKQKKYYDRFVNDVVKFNVGDLVLLNNERKLVGESKSFRVRALGPFKVISKFNDVNYKIISTEGKVQTVHYNRLRKYHLRENVQVNFPASTVQERSSSATKPVSNQVYSFITPFLLQVIANRRSKATANQNAVIEEVQVGSNEAEVVQSDDSMVEEDLVERNEEIIDENDDVVEENEGSVDKVVNDEAENSLNQTEAWFDVTQNQLDNPDQTITDETHVDRIEFLGDFNLSDHDEESSDKQPVVQDGFKCDQCEKVFGTSRGQKIHFGLVHKRAGGRM